MQPEITKVVIEFEIFELKTCVLTLIWSWFFFQGEKSEGYLNLHKFVCVCGWVGGGALKTLNPLQEKWDIWDFFKIIYMTWHVFS